MSIRNILRDFCDAGSGTLRGDPAIKLRSSFNNISGSRAEGMMEPNRHPLSGAPRL